MGIGKSLTRLAGCSALALALGGCGVPTALTVAGIAGDAVSRAATGKGMIDAAVSQVSERDCRMSRVLKGEDVCRDAAPEAAKPALAMAAAAPDAMPIADVTFEGRDGGGVMWAPVEGGWVPVDQATELRGTHVVRFRRGHAVGRQVAGAVRRRAHLVRRGLG